MMDRHYHINLFWSADDDSWVADFPDLKHCSAFGNTPEDALAEARIALDAWTASMEDSGQPMPEARYRPSKAA